MSCFSPLMDGGLEISAAPAVPIPSGSLRQLPNCGLTNGNNYRIAFLVRPCAMVETNFIEWPQACDNLHLGASLLLSRSAFVSPEKSKIDIRDANLFPSTETKLEEQVRKAGLLSKSLLQRYLRHFMWQVQGSMGKTEPCAIPYPCLQFTCNISEGEMKDKRQKSAQVMRIHKDSWTCSSCESCYLTSWTRLLITGFSNHEVDSSGAPRSDWQSLYFTVTWLGFMNLLYWPALSTHGSTDLTPEELDLGRDTQDPVSAGSASSSEVLLDITDVSASPLSQAQSWEEPLQMY